MLYQIRILMKAIWFWKDFHTLKASLELISLFAKKKFGKKCWYAFEANQFGKQWNFSKMYHIIIHILCSSHKALIFFQEYSYIFLIQSSFTPPMIKRKYNHKQMWNLNKLWTDRMLNSNQNSGIFPDLAAKNKGIFLVQFQN